MNPLHERIAASFDAQGLMRTLGARLVLVQDGEVHIEMPFSGHLSQQQGFVHAGAVTSIVDNACGYAALTRSAPGCEVVTAEFKTNFMRPAIGERFVAVGKVQSAGRMLTVCSGEVRAFAGAGPDYKVVALMQATMVSVPAGS
ncbi:PaaI family thioesterase [Alicycliphilus denitrificans]|uniref:Phenylacetic acid degradation-related protein n=1 Tax=Alicycliphilus denitrificans (strain DSM 14773 / CIP 107495 / K601) TaxID=596154 RepID=F4GB23_ALIDK|nr:PaaI family thioesterase [Alicycliphilus denitrificans]AEB83514.1 phenylacetic acid degradation-related protein [Alicycliphilus denitrificans K601]